MWSAQPAFKRDILKIVEATYPVPFCLRHQVLPGRAEMVERYGAETTGPDWAARRACGECGSRRVTFVVSDARPPIVASAELATTLDGVV